MNAKFDEFGIYNIDVSYLKHLHDNFDNEVYYVASSRYETKPFLGLVIGINSYTYFIPFSSSKPKHLSWKNATLDHYLIYEVVKENNLSSNAIYKPLNNGMAKHIIAVLDMKKMIPVPTECYSKVDFSRITNTTYKRILEKEYRFCQNIQDGILAKVSQIYLEQKESGIIRKYYCNYSVLEKACEEYIDIINNPTASDEELITTAPQSAITKDASINRPQTPHSRLRHSL